MLEDLLEGQKENFEQGVHTELRAQINKQRDISVRSGNIAKNQRTESCGVSARVSKNGVSGFSAMPEYSKEAAALVLKTATQNARFMDNHIGRRTGGWAPIPTGRIGIKKEVIDVEQKRYLEFAKDLDEYIAKTYKNIASRTVTIREDSREKLLYTSDGYDAHTAIPRTTVYITLSAEAKEGSYVVLSDSNSGFGTFQDQCKDPKEFYSLIDQIYGQLMEKREGVYAKAGYQQVILDGKMAGMLAHEAVGHTVEGDLVLSGSVAGPNLKKQVASEMVNLVDFAHTAFGKEAPLPVYVDEEGTKCEDSILIKDGVLVGYMNNRETAKKFGMRPQGNARAYSFSDEPLVRMRNTCILPGKDKIEEMISSVEDGYYLIQSGNGEADLTGEFMFGVNMGYEIKHGKLGKAILDTTVSGIAFNMLKTVDMLSDEVKWCSCGTCGKKQWMPVSMGGPAMRCKIMIGGR